ncbi:DNA repair protein RadC [uncultured Tenacibaculum sp.]|uniref:RadC family protein n=1 Tax=uncultured Tenacibaculum sp. TaxID=174713 RepID=UPI002613E99E|nr:DNA repair protein RadC [uncultured Tenacibaculum sp.]
MKKLSIKSWAIDDRPREKLLHHGKTIVTNAELIAILIGSGNRTESAVELSKRILSSVNNNLNDLAKLSIQELMRFNGIGEAKAISIITALELGKRRHFEEGKDVFKIKSSNHVFNLMQPIVGDLPHEEFWVIYLNNSNTVLDKCQISKGGLVSALVDIRLIYKKALELAAVGIILIHNHPSGKLSPSTSDIQLTEKIKKAGVALDIKVLDHLIITEKDYFSFADEGML